MRRCGDSFIAVGSPHILCNSAAELTPGVIPLKTTGATVSGASGGRSPNFCSEKGSCRPAAGELTTDFSSVGAGGDGGLSAVEGAVGIGSGGSGCGVPSGGLTT